MPQGLAEGSAARLVGGVDLERALEIAASEVGSTDGELRLSRPVKQPKTVGLEGESRLESLKGRLLSIPARFEIRELAEPGDGRGDLYGLAGVEV